MRTGYRAPPSDTLLTPEIQAKLNCSAVEAEGLSLRDVRCPHCGYVIARVYSDMRGHYLARCRKCKREQPINLAYFRRQRGIHRLKQKYYNENN